MERAFNNLRYADDTTLLIKNIEDLKRFLLKVKSENAKAELQINIKKTKVMTY